MRTKRPLRLAALGATAILATMTLAACSQAESGGGGESTASSKDVALVLGVKGSPFFQAVECGAKAQAKVHGLNLSVSAGDKYSPDTEIPIINALKAQKPAVAVITATDATALNNPINALAEAGTKVIMFDQSISDTSNVTAQIIADNAAGGKLAGDEMAKAIGEKGKVFTISPPPGSAAEDARREAFAAELKKYPNIEYLGAQYQADDPAKAAQFVTATLAAHPDLAGVFSTGDQGVIGALTGLRQANAIGKVQVVGYDAATAEVDALKNGEVAALVAQNPRQFGELAMDAANSLINGKTIPKKIDSELVVIRKGEDAKADKYEYKGNC
jgi:ribose transport system substrate-binding protein